MNNFKPATKKIKITTTLSFDELIEVPANWTDEQIDRYIEDKIDLEKIYESTPDEIDIYWNLKK